MTLLAGDGCEWIVEAFGCEAGRLTSRRALEGLFAALVDDVGLRAVAPAAWHEFPAPGGITGMLLLAESHLALHTFPEFGSATLNLFCCAPRAGWDWEGGLAHHLGATEVRVRVVERQYRDATTAAVGSAERLTPRRAAATPP